MISIKKNVDDLTFVLTPSTAGVSRGRGVLFSVGYHPFYKLEVLTEEDIDEFIEWWFEYIEAKGFTSVSDVPVKFVGTGKFPAQTVDAAPS